MTELGLAAVGTCSAALQGVAAATGSLTAT